jgi:hypothetical protein
MFRNRVQYPGVLCRATPFTRQGASTLSTAKEPGYLQVSQPQVHIDHDSGTPSLAMQLHLYVALSPCRKAPAKQGAAELRAGLLIVLTNCCVLP